jgi:mono/diheme cytochrome c family protein
VEHPSPSPLARRRRHAIAVLALALLAAFGLSACGDTVGYTEPTGDKIQGKELFVKNCGSCHTLRDAGTTGTIGPDLDYADRRPRRRHDPAGRPRADRLPGDEALDRRPRDARQYPRG